MKQLIIKLIFLVSIVVLPVQLDAQVEDLLKRKANELLEKKKKKEKKKKGKGLKAFKKNFFQQSNDSIKTDEYFEEEPAKKEKTDKQNNLLMQGYLESMGMGGNVTTEDRYQFNSSIVMEMSGNSISNNTNGKARIKFLLNSDNNNYAMLIEARNPETGEMQKSSFIYDIKNKALIMMGDDGEQKTAMIMALPDDVYNQELATTEAEELTEEDAQALAAYDALNIHYKKTGKTKNIANISCDEYRFENDSVKINVWTTKKLNFKVKSAFKNLNQMNMLFTAGAFPSGFMMEMETLDKITNEHSKIRFIEIKENTNDFIDMKDAVKMGVAG